MSEGRSAADYVNLGEALRGRDLIALGLLAHDQDVVVLCIRADEGARDRPTWVAEVVDCDGRLGEITFVYFGRAWRRSKW